MAFPRGWTTFVRETLSKDTILSAALSAEGDGIDHYELTDEIAPFPLYHRVFPNGSYFRPEGTQKFGLVVKELAGDGFASKLKDYDSNTAYVNFNAFPMTIDLATGLERPYLAVPLARFLLSGSRTGGITLTLSHSVFFDGPVGALDSGSLNDTDPITSETFTAQFPGLVTQIAFGWYYRGGADSGSSLSSGGPPLGISLGMAVALKGIDAIVVPGDSY